MKWKEYILTVSLGITISMTYSQTNDSNNKKGVTVSHYFNIGANYFFGPQYDGMVNQEVYANIPPHWKTTTPYSLRVGYDAGFNVGKYFLLQGGIQYSYNPNIYNFQYIDTVASQPVTGIDELNVQYHSLNLRLRPGVQFSVGKFYHTAILSNVFYGFNMLGRFTHTNLTPQYNYQITLEGNKVPISNYVGAGLSWLNLFRITEKSSLGLEVGYNFFTSIPFIYTNVGGVQYKGGNTYQTGNVPLMYAHALVMSLIYKYK